MHGQSSSLNPCLIVLDTIDNSELAAKVTYQHRRAACDSLRYIDSFQQTGVHSSPIDCLALISSNQPTQLETLCAVYMERLPDEVVLHVLSFLNVLDIVSLQATSYRYLQLGRDQTVWKSECFDRTLAETQRRRRGSQNFQDSGLVELRDAITAMPTGTADNYHSRARSQRNRILVSWEPGFPQEDLNYYEDYIHRHAPINVGWLDLPKCNGSAIDEVTEATGIGMLSGHLGSGMVSDRFKIRSKYLVAPMSDGSVCLWDFPSRSTLQGEPRNRLIGQSKAGMLTGQSRDSMSVNHAIMTETGAVECVSINSAARRGYFAVQNHLQEVDLTTLQLISTKHYPWPITALSTADNHDPVTVGTNLTVHLNDPRDSNGGISPVSAGVELIGGSVYSHVTLEQPGPLSILHGNGLSSSTDSVWVAGRFTSLLNYDRRFFPRILGTVHSGARIASLSSLPYPHITRSMRAHTASLSDLQAARSSPGSTILAAAEYKGKGSLELFGLPDQSIYQNRQTASASKLLSVGPHGGRIVYSDGDGNIKWKERDGYTHVRTFNINDVKPPAGQASNATSDGIWTSDHGDIVQKIIPMPNCDPSSSSRSDRHDINQSDLFLWTGDGRLGVLGFGHKNAVELHDENESTDTLSTEQKAREDAERQYGMAMRRALERNADEVRFVRGLGMV